MGPPISSRKVFSCCRFQIDGNALTPCVQIEINHIILQSFIVRGSQRARYALSLRIMNEEAEDTVVKHFLIQTNQQSELWQLGYLGKGEVSAFQIPIHWSYNIIGTSWHVSKLWPLCDSLLSRFPSVGSWYYQNLLHCCRFFDHSRLQPALHINLRPPGLFLFSPKVCGVGVLVFLKWRACFIEGGMQYILHHLSLQRR